MDPDFSLEDLSSKLEEIKDISENLNMLAEELSASLFGLDEIVEELNISADIQQRIAKIKEHEPYLNTYTPLIEECSAAIEELPEEFDEEN